MTPLLSVYLDLARCAAAFAVLLTHFWPVAFPRFPLPWPGHQGVIVFFVMSGFLIAYVAETRDKNPLDFTIRRTARIWSVAIPALILGGLVSPFTGPVDGIEAVPWTDTADLLTRTLANLFFVAQLWSVSIPPPINGPFWSLNYEVWYYVLFGAGVFLTGRTRVVTLAVLSAICGPNILLLMPCWLLGVWLYRWRPALSRGQAGLLFAVSVVLLGLAFWLNLHIWLRTLMAAEWPYAMSFLRGAGTFAGDFIIALLVTLNFMAVRGFEGSGAWLVRYRRPIGAVAALMFSVYLYHLPSILLFRAGFGLPPWAAIPAAIALVVVLGRLTESNLPWFRDTLDKAVRRFLSAAAGASPSVGLEPRQRRKAG